MLANLDNEQKQQVKIATKRRKQSLITLMLMKNRRWGYTSKKGKKLCAITLMMNKKNI